jgi:IgGFc binding protein
MNDRWLWAGAALSLLLLAGCGSTGSSVASAGAGGTGGSLDGGTGGSGGSANGTCNDHVQNGDETGVDCGGSCPPCVSCTTGSDCPSGVCTAGACAPAACTDGIRNGDETDTDCGGSCPPCGPNAACNKDSDCQNNACVHNLCQATCTDGVKDGDESDIDCGGSKCPQCPSGSACNTYTDCATGGCANGHCVVPCSAGDIVCDGTTAKTCDGHGGFSDVTDCSATNLLCATLLGCVHCIPDTGTCAGNVGSYCKADGSGYTTETCDALEGMTCDNATGRCKGDCAPSALGSSYVGCEYFPTVTANLTDSSVFHFAVAVSNTTSNAATVTITQGATTVTTQTVAANSVAKIDLPWVASLKGPSSNIVTPFPASIRVNAGAYELRSTEPVTVYQFNPLEYTLNGQYSYTNDASLLLPINAWGLQYRGIARHHFAGSSGFVAITAAQDGTSVTLTAGPQTGQFKTGVTGVDANGDGTITMNAGDVVELVSNGSSSASDPNDPTGILITATNPVQVIGGHQCTYIPDGDAACDHLEESMFPIQTLADTYVVTAPRLPNSASPKVEMVRIVSTQDNTTLTYNPGQGGAPASIPTAGGWVEIANNAQSFMITASHPVYVMQYMEGEEAGGGSGDPAMAQAVTPAQYRTDYRFHAPTNYTTNFVNIVAPVGATVTLDGAAVTGFTAIGATGYGVVRAPLSNAGTGDHTVTASKGVGLSVYGYGQYTSYWYPGGLNLTTLPQN